MTIRLTLLVDSPSRRAHGNAASRLALGFAQTGEIEPTLLCYGEDPPPSWLPAKVRVEQLGSTGYRGPFSPWRVTFGLSGPMYSSRVRFTRTSEA